MFLEQQFFWPTNFWDKMHFCFWTKILYLFGPKCSWTKIVLKTCLEQESSWYFSFWEIFCNLVGFRFIFFPFQISLKQKFSRKRCFDKHKRAAHKGAAEPCILHACLSLVSGKNLINLKNLFLLKTLWERAHLKRFVSLSVCLSVCHVLFVSQGQTICLSPRDKQNTGGTNNFHTHGGRNIFTLGEGGETFYVRGDGGYDDVDVEIDVSAKRIFIFMWASSPQLKFLWAWNSSII